MNQISPDEAPENVNAAYELVRAKLGRVPNMYQVMANSPAVLLAYVQLQSALAEGRLSKKIAESIALAAAEKNGCEYCLSAHDFLGRKVGLSSDDIFNARSFNSPDPRLQEALTFSRKLLSADDRPGEEDLIALRAAGYSDGEVLEIIAHVVRNTFTNYINLVAGTKVDWAAIVKPLEAE